MARNMGFKVEKVDLQEVIVVAPFELNYNTHGTAFGGSLSVLCTLAGWCGVAAQLMRWEMEPNIVISHGEIDYLAPIKGDLRVSCRQPGAEEWAEFKAKLLERGKAKLNLTCEAISGSDVGAKYLGTYVAIAKV